MSAKTAMHEIGHSLSIGEADEDRATVETYSGSAYDCTPEFILDEETRSIMAGGYEQPMLIGPNDARYFVISIEELMSVENYE